ncbi:hypothetical protein, partial [Actinoplanes utahensis]
MTCGLTALLRPGGPVRVPFRECCAAALFGADGVTASCNALATPRPPSRTARDTIADDPSPVRVEHPPSRGARSPAAPARGARSPAAPARGARSPAAPA